MHRTGNLCVGTLTVRTARSDNLPVHKADMVRFGEVIVVDATLKAKGCAL
ncbi:MAG: hypothetical protein ABL878_13560 [Burkholderiales bacterium]